MLRWYDQHGRDLPWRRTRDPYAIWISEIMLQQTRVDQAGPYFERFMKRFPDVASLAKAPLDAVLKTWEGMGYYSRARNLHRAANQVMEHHAGRIPEDVEELTRLAGVGDYTAGAIASIAFGLDEPVVDGNVVRLFSRLFVLDDDFYTVQARRKLWALARAVLPRGRAEQFNQAIMDLGAVVCVPRKPCCPECPLEGLCGARAAGLEEQLPRRKEKKSLPHQEVVIGVVRRRGKILISRRPPEGLLGGLWEFPGGKVEKGEELHQALCRELAEEVGIEVRIDAALATVKHAFSHFKITLHAFLCTALRGRARPLGCDAVRWIHEQDLDRFAFPTATRKVIALWKDK